jgi:hypothetical protein
LLQQSQIIPENAIIRREYINVASRPARKNMVLTTMLVGKILIAIS